MREMLYRCISLLWCTWIMAKNKAAAKHSTGQKQDDRELHVTLPAFCARDTPIYLPTHAPAMTGVSLVPIPGFHVPLCILALPCSTCHLVRTHTKYYQKCHLLFYLQGVIGGPSAFKSIVNFARYRPWAPGLDRRG